MRLIIILSASIFFVTCSSEENNDTEIPTKDPLIIGDAGFVDSIENSLPKAAYTAEVFESPNLGWGYKIFDNGILFINQPHIPAIQGNKGFSSKEKAQIAADYAILKMVQGFIPPTISPEELDSLGVLD